MNSEAMRKWAIESYSRPGKIGDAAKPAAFPEPPSHALPPAEFVDHLLAAAFERSPKLLHPCAIRLARGEWNSAQIREWVRQDYRRIVSLIRRHALLAANAEEYEIIWGLLTRVKAEADADPVGGNFFALPQLWIKFGISLGMSREEVAGARPHNLLELADQAMLNEVRFSGALPVGDFVDAALDPIFYGIWGEALEGSLGKDQSLAHDSLDFFWAMAADRWGGETGHSILERWAQDGTAQATLWNRFRSEAAQNREWHRFTILQGIVEGGAR